MPISLSASSVCICSVCGVTAVEGFTGKTGLQRAIDRPLAGGWREVSNKYDYRTAAHWCPECCRVHDQAGAAALMARAAAAGIEVEAK